MDDKLKLVRQIIISPAFQTSSKEQQKEILEQIIETGEISSDDIIEIYNTNLPGVSYLESLPYNVFLGVFINGDIAGKDLINLCNSSNLINQQCNKPFKVEDTGETIPQYLFVLLLQKMGVDYYQVRQRRPNLSPRDIYLYYFVGDGVRFRRLDDKLKYITSILDEESFMPKNLFDLLYDENGEQPGFLNTLFGYHRSLQFKKVQYVLETINNIIEDFLDVLGDIPALSEIDDIAKRLGQTSEELLTPWFELDLVNNRRMDGFHHLFPNYEFTLENYIKISSNYLENFRQDLLSHPAASDYNTLFGIAENTANHINKYIGHSDNLDLSKLFDHQDVEYIIKLHMRILSGELKINTPLQIDDLL